MTYWLLHPSRLFGYKERLSLIAIAVANQLPPPHSWHQLKLRQ